MASGTVTVIRSRASTCIDLFRDCVSRPGLRGLPWLEVGQADFNLWVCGLNAASAGKASLDHRIRERRDVQVLIGDLLDGLAESLRDCLDQEESSMSNSADDESALASETLQAIEFDIKTILRQLSRIHVAILRAGSKLRHRRADATLHHALKSKTFVDWREEMQNLILMGIENQDRASRIPTLPHSKFLTPVQERLVHSNLLRRHRIEYATNSLRLAQKQAAKRAAKRDLEESEQPLLAIEDQSSDLTPPKAKDLPEEAAPDLTGDSTIDPGRRNRGEPSLAGETELASEIESEAQRTATDLASNFRVDPAASRKSATIITKATQTGRKQDYPRWPKDAGLHGDVPCPYCAEPLSADYIRNEVRWRGHLAADLTPYVCVIENCRTPDAMFVTTEELNRHVRQEHGVYHWVCDYCVDDLQADETMVFDTAKDWISHVTEAHFKEKPATQFEALSETTRRKMIEPVSCPLCDFSVMTVQPAIDDHITQHMHSFALRALPWGISDDQAESSARDAAADSESNDDSEYDNGEDAIMSLHDTFPIFDFLDEGGLTGEVVRNSLSNLVVQVRLSARLNGILHMLPDNQTVDHVASRLLRLCCTAFQLWRADKYTREYTLEEPSFDFSEEIYSGLVSLVEDELNALEDLLRPATSEGRATPEGKVTPEGSVASTPEIQDLWPSLDLPAIKRRYNPEKLTSRDFDQCSEPWALSDIAQWLRRLVEDEHLENQSLVAGLVALFTHKLPTMGAADAETLATQVVEDMLATGTLRHEEEWLCFSDSPISGVIYQLTGAGCYSSRVHNYEDSTRCYSRCCQRRTKKLDLFDQSDIDEDWKEFYNVTLEDIGNYDKKEVERQNILHELVMKEEQFIRELRVLRTGLHDGLANANPPLLSAKKLSPFLQTVFGKAGAVEEVDIEYLLPQMKYRQMEQGPWLVGFSDLHRNWVRKARHAYIDYASTFSHAMFTVRNEMQSNVRLRRFFDEFYKDPRSRRLGYEHYLTLPITHMTQIGLTLHAVLQRSVQDNEEKRNLEIAFEEIMAVARECDERVGDGDREVELADLRRKFTFDPNLQLVELNLLHPRRELVFRGDLRIVKGFRNTPAVTHAVLFDHYFVLAEPQMPADGVGEPEYYIISRSPIPMKFLELQSRDDDPLVRSTATGLWSLAKSVTQRQDNASNERIMYPFRIRHLGSGSYTLCASSVRTREEWCHKILTTKTRHAHVSSIQIDEPFMLRVIADTAFYYDSSGTRPGSFSMIKGNALDVAIRNAERAHGDSNRPSPACRSSVNCATTINMPDGKQMVAIGTDNGVYVSKSEYAIAWSRASNVLFEHGKSGTDVSQVSSNKYVTQIAVIEDPYFLLLISDQSLFALPLDVISATGGGTSLSNVSARGAPQKLSGNRDVGFFTVGQMKSRKLVFFKKREGFNSVIKVLQAELQGQTEKKSRFLPLRTSKTEYFRDFDEFYISSQCTGIDVFNSSLFVRTDRRFEMLTLEDKRPLSIPLGLDDSVGFASLLRDKTPLGMFRLQTPTAPSSAQATTPPGDQEELLLCYDDIAVYINSQGAFSRICVGQYVCKARRVAVYGGYILLFHEDFVEIRNTQNGRLRQVISGVDIKCLDDAQGHKGNVKISMQHPYDERLQLVLELVLKDGH